jgi:acyl carrier protein
MTPTEEVVASAYTAILGVADLEAHDDIFDIGGDSMQAVQIALRLEIRFDIEIPIETLEGSSRICDVAALIDRQLAARGATAVGA